MISEYQVGNTAVGSITSDQASWMELAGALFAMGPVAVLEGSTIFARVNGYVDDPVYGKIIRIERIDENGRPVSADGQKGEGV